MKVLNLTGHDYNGILVLCMTARRRWNGAAMFLCKCHCGKQVIVRGDGLRNGNTKSCGCIGRRTGSKSQSYRHGMSGSRLYTIWAGMVARCTNDKLPHYGGKGVSVCEGWESFVTFSEDMGDAYIEHCIKYGKKNTTLDRRDGGIGYSAKNCRWATYKIQGINRKGVVPFTAVSPSGKVYSNNICHKDFALAHNLTRSCISRVLRRERRHHKLWKFYYTENRDR